MGKRIICKNASNRFGGSEKQIMIAQLIKQQYPKGSVFPGSENDSIDMGLDLDADVTAMTTGATKNRFMNVRVERVCVSSR